MKKDQKVENYGVSGYYTFPCQTVRYRNLRCKGEKVGGKWLKTLGLMPRGLSYEHLDCNQHIKSFHGVLRGPTQKHFQQSTNPK
jgi:hypothetical protein